MDITSEELVEALRKVDPQVRMAVINQVLLTRLEERDAEIVGLRRSVELHEQALKNGSVQEGEFV